MKILIIILCGILWRLGGWDKARWSGFRDVLIPIILGAFIAFTVKWWIGLICIGSLNIIRMGYGAYDPEHDDKPSLLAALTHDRSGISERALAGFLYGFIGFFPLMIYSCMFVKIPLFALGVASISAILCAFKARDFIIEPLIGASVASIVFLI